MRVGFFDTIFRAPLARLLAVEQLTAPWANDNDLSRVTFEDWYGSGDGLRVSRTTAMRLPMVAKGRNVLTGTVGRLKLYTYKNDKRTTIQPSCLAQPEAGKPRSETLMWLADALMFHPQSWFLVKTRDSYGWPMTFEWIDRTRAQWTDTGELTHIDNAPVVKTDPQGRANVIQFNSPLGAGLLIDGIDIIRRAMVISIAAATAEDNPVPTIELHNEGDEPDDTTREAMMDIWQKNRRRRGVAWTSKGIKAVAHGQHPEQLLIEGRKAIDFGLIRQMNFPAWVGDLGVEGQSLSYSNRQSRFDELVNFSIIASILMVIADRLSMDDVTPHGWEAKFDLDIFLRPDLKARFETYALGKKGKFVTNQWIADQEGWETPAPEETVTNAP